MIRRLLLIDYENIQTFDLSRLAEDVDVVVFVGAQQRIRVAQADAADKLHDRVIWVKMGGTGPNALDFHIACHLGRVLEIDKRHACYILSNDKGFDPLLAFLGKLGLSCFRINNLSMLGVALSPEEEVIYRKVVGSLRKQSKPQRPHSRAALIKFIASKCPRRPTAMQVNSIIARIVAGKLLILRDDTVSYG